MSSAASEADKPSWGFQTAAEGLQTRSHGYVALSSTCIGSRRLCFMSPYNLLPTHSKMTSLDLGLWSLESLETQSSVYSFPCLGPQLPPH